VRAELRKLVTLAVPSLPAEGEGEGEGEGSQKESAGSAESLPLPVPAPVVQGDAVAESLARLSQLSAATRTAAAHRAVPAPVGAGGSTGHGYPPVPLGTGAGAGSMGSAGSMGRGAVDTRVGAADLDPFSGTAPHDLRGMPGGRAGGGLVAPAEGAGSLVGPGHPLFRQRDEEVEGGGAYMGGQGYGGEEGGFPGFGGCGEGTGGVFPGSSGMRLPQPRFDSFMPPLGPGGDLSGGPGLGGRGGRGVLPTGGRGVGGRGGRGLFPGEPNHDHLQPPGW
jgi:hypothetical protein